MAQRAEEDSQAILNDGFQQLFSGEESLSSMLHRKNSFKEAWDIMNKDITVSIHDGIRILINNKLYWPVNLGYPVKYEPYGCGQYLSVCR